MPLLVLFVLCLSQATAELQEVRTTLTERRRLADAEAASLLAELEAEDSQISAELG